MTKKERIMADLLSLEGSVEEQYKDMTLIRYERRGTICLAVWYGPGWRPQVHLRFHDMDEREYQVAREMKRADERAKVAEVRKKQVEKEAMSIQPGTILVGSWGYEQTNVDFYKVLERKGNALTIVEIGQERKDEENQFQGSCIADPGRIIGQPFKKRINKWGGVTINSCECAYVWDGKPKSWSNYA